MQSKIHILCPKLQSQNCEYFISNDWEIYKENQNIESEVSDPEQASSDSGDDYLNLTEENLQQFESDRTETRHYKTLGHMSLYGN